MPEPPETTTKHPREEKPVGPPTQERTMPETRRKAPEQPQRERTAKEQTTGEQK